MKLSVSVSELHVQHLSSTLKSKPIIIYTTVLYKLISPRKYICKFYIYDFQCSYKIKDVNITIIVPSKFVWNSIKVLANKPGYITALKNVTHTGQKLNIMVLFYPNKIKPIILPFSNNLQAAMPQRPATFLQVLSLYFAKSSSKLKEVNHKQKKLVGYSCFLLQSFFNCD